jgi:hypothetical protein
VVRTFAIVFLLAGIAHANPITVGPEVGVRIGGGPTYGKADGNANRDLSYNMPGQFLFQLDGGVRLASLFYVGAYASYSVGLTDNCGNGTSCSASVIRFGGNVAIHPLRHPIWDPYVGIGFGYEDWQINATSALGKGKVEANGVELFHLDLGVDRRVSGHVALGGFVLVTLSQFGSETATGGGFAISGSVTNKSAHGYVLFGIRCAFLP